MVSKGKKEVFFIENRSEIGDGLPGASMGIDALKIAAVSMKSSLFATVTSVNVAHENELLYKVVNKPFAKRVHAIGRLYERMVRAFSVVDLDQRFPIVLAGDHASAGGTIAGIKARYPDQEIGVVWIDAHADIHSPWTTPSGNMHGMPIAASLAMDHKSKAVNDVSIDAMNGWEVLKSVGGISPKIKPENLAYIGLRDCEAQEWEVMAENGIPNITVEQVGQIGVSQVVAKVFERLEHCDRIYVSFDVDSMDPSVSSGTGTPVHGGLALEQARELLLQLVQHPKICCLEVAEINPALDSANRMAEAAFSLLDSVVKVLRK